MQKTVHAETETKPIKQNEVFFGGFFFDWIKVEAAVFVHSGKLHCEAKEF